MEIGKLQAYFKSRFDKYKYALILCLCGLMLACISGGEPAKAASTEATELLADVDALEARLEDSLSRISGVGKVSVVLTAKSSSAAVYAYDEDQTIRQSNGERTSDSTQSMAFSGSGSGQQPIRIQTLEPEYRGALVVCQGAASAAVRLEVTRAVAALTGIGSDHIVVSKMK
ncbi:MAG: hypothetical protein IJC44_04105 [Clostridia bacterium]|nr:hypothetical protein [Clostridia bacterium]